MVAPEIADQLTEDDYDQAFAEAGLTLLTAKKLAELRRRHTTKTELTTRDFVEYYRNKISTFAPFLLSRITDGPVSINKMRPGRNTILGIVRDPEENGFQLEDPTGRCAVIARVSDAQENDVVVVSGTLSGDKFTADGVIYPELPVKKHVKRALRPAKLFFGSVKGDAGPAIKKLSGDRGTETFAFIIETSGGIKRLVSARIINGDAETTAEPAASVKALSGPGGEELKIQLFHTALSVPIETAARSASRRRCVAQNSLSSQLVQERYIDEDADVILLGESAKSGFVNHRGYTFVTAGDKFVGIDLQTRSAWIADF